MNAKRLLTILGVTAVLALTPTLAADMWLHVYVDESGEDGEQVRVNIPLSVVENILPHIDVDEFHNGRIHILDEMEGEGIDLREMWNAISEAADGEFVTVKGPDENVRVAKENGLFLVNVDGDDEKVRVRIPLDIVGAMFEGGDENELDVLAALQAMANYPNQDFVTVEDGDTRVRIWVDDRNEID